MKQVIPTGMPTIELPRLRDDIQRGYEALRSERLGILTPLQLKRLQEIRLPLQHLSVAVDEFVAAFQLAPDARSFEPRARLTYAAAVPLEMILRCSYFLQMSHMRNQETLNPDQREAVWLIERSGRRLIIEVEHLWRSMKAEQETAPSTKSVHLPNMDANP